MNDTVAAVSTAYGEGGIGIIRISGDLASAILERIFVPADGGTLRDRVITYGHIKDPSSSETIDEVLVVLMKAPRTYTKEDVAEIHCHGSIVALRRTLELVFASGASPAAPGEFTKRAFLNGRIDLAQADAVIDLVRAKTDAGFDIALGRLGGRMSERIGGIRNALADILASIVVDLDYPDEDDAAGAGTHVQGEIVSVRKDVETLLDTADTGRMIMDGINVVITGKPNVGKSSLMNALLRESRAIVTEVPGTTRDTIDEYLNIKGIPVRLTDTAGVRDSDDVVERIGIEKTLAAATQADMIILVLDGSEPITEEDINLADRLGERVSALVFNKSDLAAKEDRITDKLPLADVVRLSALTGEGIETLENLIVDFVYGGKIRQGDSALITNAVQKGVLTAALEGIKQAEILLEDPDGSLDLAEIELRTAYDLLGEITGETVTEDILERVFSRFCIGK